MARQAKASSSCEAMSSPGSLPQSPNNSRWSLSFSNGSFSLGSYLSSSNMSWMCWAHAPKGENERMESSLDVMCEDQQV